MSGQTPYIIGVGPGNPGFLYPIAKDLIDRADIVIGGRRQLAEFAPNAPQTAVIDRGLAAILTLIEANWREKRLVVLASGDTGLFSIRAYLQNRLPHVPFAVLPGISSLQCLLAHCNANLNDLKIITLHGAADSLTESTAPCSVLRMPLPFSCSGSFFAMPLNTSHHSVNGSSDSINASNSFWFVNCGWRPRTFWMMTFPRITRSESPCDKPCCI